MGDFHDVCGGYVGIRDDEHDRQIAEEEMLEEEKARSGGEPWSDEEKEAIADGTADLPRATLFPATFAEHARYLAIVRRNDDAYSEHRNTEIAALRDK